LLPLAIALMARILILAFLYNGKMTLRKWYALGSHQFIRRADPYA
jgi:hypothetical protein